MITFSDVQNSSIVNVASKPPNSPAFAQLINDAIRRLMRRGDWSGTVVPIRVCIKGGCVTWPRYVGNVRYIKICDRHIPVHNVWYDFLEHSGDYRDCNWWGRGGVGMNEQGKYSTYNDIYADTWYVRAYCQLAVDVGKTITIFGVDTNNQPLRHTTGNGQWLDGLVLTLTSTYAQTPVFIRRIDRVVKDVTQGPVTLYGYDSVNNVQLDLAVYEPSETSPSYQRHNLQSGQCCASNCSQVMNAVALVKLAFIPVSAPTDLVIINNIPALKLMVQSINFEEAGDREQAREYEMDAIRELNAQLEDENPASHVPVDNDPFSGADIGRQHCF